MANKAVIVVGGIIVGGLLVFALTRKAKPVPPPPPAGLANIYGKVTDTGKSISEVTVSASSPDTDTAASGLTDTNGQYSLENLEPGSYDVEFVKAGYGTKTLSIEVEEGNNELNALLSATGGADQFYMPSSFTKAKVTGRWDMPPYYYTMEFECPIKNSGNTTGTHKVTVSNNHPEALGSWDFNVTLAPGETYLWKYTQNAIWPMTFYLDGNWVGNNHSAGTAS